MDTPVSDANAFQSANNGKKTGRHAMLKMNPASPFTLASSCEVNTKQTLVNSTSNARAGVCGEVGERRGYHTVNRSRVLRMQKLRTPPGESQGLSKVPSF